MATDARSEASSTPTSSFCEKADEVIVVEVKADGDITDTNTGKLAYATAHFEKLNELLKAKRHKRRYQFHFLSPSDYDDFFAGLRDATLKGWVSTLQAALERVNARRSR